MTEMDLTTLRVTQSQVLLRADNRGAIALYFDKGEPIAIEMSPHIVSVLQRQLAQLAAHFGSPTSSAE